MTFDSLALVTVVGEVLRLDDTPAQGQIVFNTTLRLTDRVTGQAVFPKPLTAVLDADGKFSIALPATDDADINPLDWHYVVTVQITGLSERVYYLQVPGGSSPLELFLAVAEEVSEGVFITQGVKGDQGIQGIQGNQGIQGVFTGNEALVAKGNVAGAVTCDLSTASAFTMTLTANTTVTFTNAASGKVSYATLRVTQGGAGNFTLTIAGAQGSFATQPVLSSAAGKVDKIACESWNSGTNWDVALTGQAIA